MAKINGRMLLNQIEKAMMLKESKGLVKALGLKVDCDSVSVVRMDDDKSIFAGIGPDSFNDFDFIQTTDGKKIAKFLKLIGNKGDFDVSYDVDSSNIMLSDLNGKKKLTVKKKEKDNAKALEYVWNKFNQSIPNGKIEKHELEKVSSCIKFASSKKDTHKSLSYVYGNENIVFATDSIHARKVDIANQMNNVLIDCEVLKVASKNNNDISISTFKNDVNDFIHFMQFDDVVMAWKIDNLTYPNAENLYKNYNDTDIHSKIDDGKSFMSDLKFIDDFSDEKDKAKIVNIDFENGMMKSFDGEIETDMSDYFENYGIKHSSYFDMKYVSKMFDISNSAIVYHNRHFKPLYIDYLNGVLDIYLPIKVNRG